MEHFCNCEKTDCPLHPKNHDKGCSLCIAKNLKTHEMPSCFFNSIGAKDRPGDSYEDFARAVLNLRGEEK